MYCAAHIEQFAPVHELRHVHVQPVFWFPVTDTALPLQFALVVHVRKHAGYVSYPLRHTLQSAPPVPLYGNAHVEHDASVQLPRHLHAQFPASPLTLTLWPLQSDALHSRVQFGYPPYPLTHAAQFADAFTFVGHCAQLLPPQLFWHVQLQPVLLFPLTLAACPLQLLAFVHVRKHDGYVS